MVISVRVTESGVCVHISGEDCVWYVCDVLYAVVYVRVSYFVVRGYAVSRRYISHFLFNSIILSDHISYLVCWCSDISLILLTWNFAASLCTSVMPDLS